MRRTAALAATVLGPLVVGACATPSTSLDDRIAALADDLSDETDGALSDDQAQCVAEALYDASGHDGVGSLLAEARSGDADGEARLAVIDAFALCDAIAPLLTEPTTTTTTTTAAAGGS